MRYEVDVREIRVLDLDVYTSCRGVFFFGGKLCFCFCFCFGVGQCDTISVIKRRPVVLFLFLPQVPPLSNQAFSPSLTIPVPPLPYPTTDTATPLSRSSVTTTKRFLIPGGMGNPPSTKKTSDPLHSSFLPPPLPPHPPKQRERKRKRKGKTPSSVRSDFTFQKSS